MGDQHDGFDEEPEDPTPVATGWRVRTVDLAANARGTLEHIEAISCSPDPDLNEAAACFRTLATVWLAIARHYEKAAAP